ncbi:MAG: hypothetical protein R2865_07380 [Deinococcales bacterium]
MSIVKFNLFLKTLFERSADLKEHKSDAKPEALTQDSLLTPLLEALGYGPDERRPEAGIRSLTLSKEWVDYFFCQLSAKILG